MLNKKESALMRVIYKKTTKNKGMCLIRPVDLMVGISYGIDFKAEDLEPTMKALVYDEYKTLFHTSSLVELESWSSSLV